MEAVDEVPDEIVGFHGQQAADKLLEAVLGYTGSTSHARTRSAFCSTCSTTAASPRLRTCTASSCSTRSASSSATKRRSTRSPSTARRCESCSSVFEPGPRPTSRNAASTRRRDPRCCLGGRSEFDDVGCPEEPRFAAVDHEGRLPRHAEGPARERIQARMRTRPAGGQRRTRSLGSRSRPRPERGSRLPARLLRRPPTRRLGAPGRGGRGAPSRTHARVRLAPSR
jgi:hypothetical protein